MKAFLTTEEYAFIHVVEVHGRTVILENNCASVSGFSLIPNCVLTF